MTMNALIISFFAVATAEIGDKTQLIALCLATRFGKPVPVILGIFAATLASLLMAGIVGQWIGIWLNGHILHWLLAASFLGAAIWAFIPDTLDCAEVKQNNHGIFLTSFIAFFLAEMGDKTQLATVALAAQFQSLCAVVIGTTLGMMAVNAPVVILSHTITSRVSIKWVRASAGVVFAFLGVYEVSKALL